MTNTPRPRPVSSVSAGDLIEVAKRDVKVVTVETVKVGGGQRQLQVWGIDDRGEAVLAAWTGTGWKGLAL
jgi:hypothetical protein